MLTLAEETVGTPRGSRILEAEWNDLKLGLGNEQIEPHQSFGSTPCFDDDARFEKTHRRK